MEYRPHKCSTGEKKKKKIQKEYIWEYFDNQENVWVTLDSATNKRIEDTYNNTQECSVVLSHSDIFKGRVIVFKSMEMGDPKGHASTIKVRTTEKGDTQHFAKWDCRAKRKFTNYDDPVNLLIEKAFQSGLSRVSVNLGEVQYSIDFDLMIQKNEKTGFTRQVRRKVAPSPTFESKRKRKLISTTQHSIQKAIIEFTILGAENLPAETEHPTILVRLKSTMCDPWQSPPNSKTSLIEFFSSDSGKPYSAYWKTAKAVAGVSTVKNLYYFSESEKLSFSIYQQNYISTDTYLGTYEITIKDLKQSGCKITGHQNLTAQKFRSNCNTPAQIIMDLHLIPSAPAPTSTVNTKDLRFATFVKLNVNHHPPLVASLNNSVASLNNSVSTPEPAPSRSLVVSSPSQGMKSKLTASKLPKVHHTTTAFPVLASASRSTEHTPLQESTKIDLSRKVTRRNFLQVKFSTNTKPVNVRKTTRSSTEANNPQQQQQQQQQQVPTSNITSDTKKVESEQVDPLLSEPEDSFDAEKSENSDEVKSNEGEKEDEDEDEGEDEDEEGDGEEDGENEGEQTEQQNKEEPYESSLESDSDCSDAESQDDTNHQEILDKCRRIKDKYEFIEKIGTGAFGEVWKASLKSKGVFVAIKRIPAQLNASEEDLKSIENEIKCLLDVDTFKTKNCLGALGSKEIRGEYYIIMPLATRCTLFDYINDKHESSGGIKRRKAAKIMMGLLRGVMYLHSIGICHRDIKPENILLSGSLSKCKLADYGISVQFEPIAVAAGTYPVITGTDGTWAYMAPEVFMGRYTISVDYWSCGVVAYVICLGCWPWDDDDNLMLQIMTGKENFEELETFGKESEDNREAVDFVKKLMCRDVSKRMTPQMALEHPWLAKRKGEKEKEKEEKEKEKEKEEKEKEEEEEEE